MSLVLENLSFGNFQTEHFFIKISSNKNHLLIIKSNLDTKKLFTMADNLISVLLDVKQTFYKINHI